MDRLINKFGLGFDKIKQDGTGRYRKEGDRKESTGRDRTDRN